MFIKKITPKAVISTSLIHMMYFGMNSATAQTSQLSKIQLEEIVVTAQRRAENLSDVPVAISAFTEDSLSRLGIDNVLDISASIPNTQVSASLGVTSIFLRGIGSNVLGVGADSSIAYHLNGVYVARARAQTGGFFDVERIEIVRGPQGDLYGRNATGGSVNVITRKPTEELTGGLSISYGNYNARRLEGVVSGPIVENTVLARFAGFSSQRDGYGENIITGSEVDNLDEYGGRFSLDITPTSELSIGLVGDYYSADDSNGISHYLGSGRPDVQLTALKFGGVVPDDIRDIAAEEDVGRDLTVQGLSATVSYDISDNLTLKSITGYRDSKSTMRSSIPGGSVLNAIITQYEEQDQISQEFQLLLNGNNWDMVLGGYYFREKVIGDVYFPLYFAPGAKFHQEGVGETRSYAAFAHVNYELSDRFTLIGGLRYSKETREADGEFTDPFVPVPTGGEKDWDAVTPKVGIQFHPNKDLMLYASASKGFKSGSFIIGADAPPTDPEYLWSYEVGLKATLLQDRLQMNLAAFYYDYEDLVVTLVKGTPGGGTVVSNENAAAATIQGFEAEVSLQATEGLRLDLSLGYLDAEYDEYSTADPVYPERGELDLSGNRLTNSPKLTARIGAEYRVGNLSVSGDVVFSDEVYFTPFNDKSNAYRPSYQMVNSQIKYDFESGLSLSIFGHNLTDEEVVGIQAISSSTFGYPKLGPLYAPRTFGVKTEWIF
ncbi:TonB-dependent receptor [Aestuariicella hydrocarbonica]|uniref:TonB-dependent receptor n=1 Tax=Pseudomaricurvus hydrocarbonicus TaxID=1470433 RepID=A0A9E5K0J5_9GAMM|nr:TonB-dependent receptor [Aestuariicella hydrocarbonica]NHO66362.1 TonB-dependent receptor [Aestuariicella hydrocarbonica]